MWSLQAKRERYRTRAEIRAVTLLLGGLLCSSEAKPNITINHA